MKNYMMLACPTLKREISAIMEEKGLRYPVFYLPESLHQMPEKLKSYLADFIPRLEGVDYLLLPMGRCGNGTVGIPSGKTTLVLPKCEDCINLLLSEGSLSAVDRPKYTYFFTDSWLDCERSFTNEYKFCVEKYGQSRADMLMQAMYAHYKYFGYVDTGYGDFESSADCVRPLAKVVDTEIRRLRAPYGALRKMLTLELDEDFVLVPPGNTVTYDMFN